MNKKESQEITYFPREALDKAINEKFKEHDPQAESSLGLLSMKYSTKWREDLPVDIHKQIQMFVEGFMAGNLELRERISDPEKWIG